MIGNNGYAYDLSIPKVVPEYIPSKRDFKVIKNTEKKTMTKGKVSPVAKNKLSLVASVVVLFALLIIVSLRYNLISEKNLELQRLKIEQENVDSMLATTEVEVEQIVDKDTVESYAKQQLGMQKPEKSQMIYINSDYETKVESVSSGNIFQKGLEKIKNLIGM